MKMLKHLMATVGLLLTLTVSAFAQTTLTSTTFVTAVTATATQVQVVSTSGIEVGDYMAVLARGQVAEIMTVRAINSPFVTVSRGTQFPAVAHLNASVIYHAPPAQFYTTDPLPNSPCTRASELYLPHINRISRVVTQCASGGIWYRLDLPNNGTWNLIEVSGTATLDGSNPTPVTTGLNGIVSCQLTANTATAPGDDPNSFTATFANGGTLNIQAFKNTNGTDPTQVASTDSATSVAWSCKGT